MPVKGGFEMTQDGRIWEEQQAKPRLPVIAITTNALKGDAEQCLDAEMDDYLAKPVEIKSLEHKSEISIGGQILGDPKTPNAVHFRYSSSV